MNTTQYRRIVLILAAGGLLALAMVLVAFRPIRAAGPWYVAPSGDDGNACTSPGETCASINGALAKPGFVLSDTILVATGIYTGTGLEVVLLDKDVILSGGWDGAFATQSGTSTIYGEGSRGGLRVYDGVTAIVERFTVQSGSEGFYGEGGILNFGTLTLNSCTVSGNTAFHRGGGIINDHGTLILNHSTVNGNTAGDFGGGIVNEVGTLILNNSTVCGNKAFTGAGIGNQGATLILNNSTVCDNLAWVGGGIHNFEGILTLNSSSVSGNRAKDAGGIYNESFPLRLHRGTISGKMPIDSDGSIAEPGTLTLNNSTVSGNTSSGDEGGGGITNWRGTLILNSSTISGNSTSEGTGGGIYNRAGTSILYNSTLSGNSASAGTGGGIYIGDGTLTLISSTLSGNRGADGGGVGSSGTVTVTLQNTLLAGNAASGTGPDCSGPVGSAGYNLIGDTSGCTFSPSTGDLTNVNTELSALIGSPAYHPLVPGSPAIDAVPPDQCGLVTDQRGVTRPQGPACDIGAYEYTTPGPAASVQALGGTPQHAPPLFAFALPIQAAVLDSVGSPVTNATVTFSAPASGASGTFADSGTTTTTAVSDETGIATAATFTANGLEGRYTVSAMAGSGTTPGYFLLSNLVWYVAPGGYDANDCLTAATPCATIDGPFGKGSFLEGDTVLVGSGTYAGSGEEVLLLHRDATLSGGWDETFTARNGTSIIDGEGVRRGIGVEEQTVTIERFTVQNCIGGGIRNFGNLTLNHCTVSENRYSGGISNLGSLTLNRSTVSGNGGGISNSDESTAFLNNSTVTGNAGTGILNSGSVTLHNSTVSGNWNLRRGGGIWSTEGMVILQNSIVAGNRAPTGPDCWGAIQSAGYSLVGDSSDCTLTTGPGDLSDLDAGLGQLIGAPGVPKYHPLLSGSPAIDAGDPAGCTDNQGNPLDTDQRWAPRVGRCDMGAYEYTVPGPPVSLTAFAGTPQRTPPSTAFWLPLQAALLDGIGTPVGGTMVVFSAPTGGPSGTFAETGDFTTTGATDENGVATAAVFTANGAEGSYEVIATASGVATPASFLLSNVGWYVVPGGDDANDCQTPATPCATIDGPLGKGGFLAGDTVLVASGTYAGTGQEVVLLDKSVRLLGGWDGTFGTQGGASVIDGEDARRGITVNSGVTALVARFTVRNGREWSSGGGIDNTGVLTLNNCAVNDNNGGDNSGGIRNNGILALNNSTVSGNRAGISNHGILSLNSSTVFGNTAGNCPGGIENAYGVIDHGTATLQNTIVAGNTTSWCDMDCDGFMDSMGYNLIGSTAGCTFTATVGDLTNVDARLGPLEGSPGFHPLPVTSPAFNAGNPAGCMGSTGPLLSDQRGAPRLWGRCDIGAYEREQSAKTVNSPAALPGTPLTYTIALDNRTAIDFANVRVTDTLPVSLTYHEASLTATSGSYGYSNGTVSWAGSVSSGDAVTITFGATISQAAHLWGSIVNSAIVNGGGRIITHAATTGVFAQVFLPCMTRQYCADFFDGFDSPASGWAVVDDPYVRSEYLNGEYRILTNRRAGYFYPFRSPTCDRQNYVVEVDGRWAGTRGSGYGLVFGVTPGLSRYYLFDINTDEKEFRLLRRDEGGFTVLVPPTRMDAIYSSLSNHLKVNRNGDQITLEINGTVLGTWSDSTISGRTGAGLVSSAYKGQPPSDARFDNFSMVSLPGGGAPAPGAAGERGEEGERAAPNAWREPVPADMDW